MTRVTLFLVVLCLALPVPTHAAPMPPSTQFALNLALRHTGGIPNCEAIDAQVIPDRADEPTFMGEAPPCSIYVTRQLAAPREFAKACLVIFQMVGILRGEQQPATLPEQPICLSRMTFLMNHPRYLERRFG